MTMIGHRDTERQNECVDHMLFLQILYNTTVHSILMMSLKETARRTIVPLTMWSVLSTTLHWPRNSKNLQHQYKSIHHCDTLLSFYLKLIQRVIILTFTTNIKVKMIKCTNFTLRRPFNFTVCIKYVSEKDFLLLLSGKKASKYFIFIKKRDKN